MNRIKPHSKIIALGFAFFFFFSNLALAYLGDSFFLPPFASWRTLTTQHFRVVFQAKNETEARQSAYFLEDAHKTLAPFYSYEPTRRTTVIVVDNTDLANGATSAIGAQGMVLLLTGPDPYSSVGEYDHWLRNLIIHEYAHFLTLDQTRGFFDFTRVVFGDLFLPNHFWPTWLAEGIAVEAETVHTGQGRGNGAYYATLTRHAVARDAWGTRRFLSFDQIFGPIPDFPFGEGLYYSGYQMFSEMTQRFGADAAARFSKASSGRFPFFLNGTLEHLGDTEFSDLWYALTVKKKEELKPELEWLKNHGTPEPENKLTQEKNEAIGARLSPDQTWLAYFNQTGHDRPGLHLQDVASHKDTKVDDAITGAGLAFSPDSKKIYYAKVDFNGPFALTSDLYEMQTQSHSVHRLTHGERAKDPDFCQVNGRSLLIYTTHRARQSELKSFDLESKAIQTLYSAPEHHHISMPRCSADGQFVYFAEHGTKPRDWIARFAFADQKTTALFGGYEQGFGALYPDPQDDGSVLFTHVKDGFYSLAKAVVVKGSPEQGGAKVTVLARSAGGYWMPRKAKNHVVASYLSSQGLQVVLLEAEKLKPVSIEGFQKNAANPKAPVEQNSPKIEAAAAPTSSYNFLTSLKPRIWSPHILVADDQYQLGGLVLGWDDIDVFEYSLNPYYDSIAKSVEGNISTLHRVGPLRFSLFASSEVTDFVKVGSARAFAEERNYGGRISRLFPGVFSSWDVGAVGEWARTWIKGDFTKRIYPGEFRFGPSILYDNRQRYAYSITPEKGRAAQFEARRMAVRSAGSYKALLSYEEILPLPSHANLSLKTYLGAAWRPNALLPQSLLSFGRNGDKGDLNPPLRGYVRSTYPTTRAAVLQSELRIPFNQVFRGNGTFPLFFKNMGGFLFYDAAQARGDDGRASPHLNSAGGGFLLNSVLFYNVPLQLRLEYAYGFKKKLGAENVVFFYLSL